MPTTLQVRNVHEALPKIMFLLLEEGRQEESRNGEVFVYAYPLTTLYHRPQERVVFYHERDANPFFHFMEAMGFIGNIQDVEFYATYAKQIRQYSDDGKTLPASYGVRLRSHFDFQDQLAWAIKRLRNDANDRRVVLSMWNPELDPMKADNGSRDVPCNTNIFVAIRNGRLCIQVNCRSNDGLWGLTGANAVHMSFFQEYIAAGVGVPVGWYAQNSFNLHAYRSFWEKLMNERRPLNPDHGLRRDMALPDEDKWNPYADGTLGSDPTHSLMQTQEYDRSTDFKRFDSQLSIFLSGGADQADGLTDPFFTRVAVPIRDAHAAYRRKDYNLANALIAECQAADWRLGCHEWFNRRAAERERVAAAA